MASCDDVRRVYVCHYSLLPHDRTHKRQHDWRGLHVKQGRGWNDVHSRVRVTRSCRHWRQLRHGA